jgi:hypothetical protein
VSCPCISAEADEEMPKIKKAGGISRFLDAILYRNSIIENKLSVEMTGPTVVGHIDKLNIPDDFEVKLPR